MRIRVQTLSGLFFGVTLLMSMMTNLASAEKQSTRPNIILVLVDDQG